MNTITKNELLEADRLATIYAGELRGQGWTPSESAAVTADRVMRLEFQNGELNRACLPVAKLAAWARTFPGNPEFDLEFSPGCTADGGAVTIRRDGARATFNYHVGSAKTHASLTHVPAIRFDDDNHTLPSFRLVKPDNMGNLAAQLKTAKAAKAFGKLLSAEIGAKRNLKTAVAEHCARLAEFAGGFNPAKAKARAMIAARRLFRAALKSPADAQPWIAGESILASGAHELTPDHWQLVADIATAKAALAEYKPRTKYPRWDREKKYGEKVYGPAFDALKHGVTTAQTSLRLFIVRQFKAYCEAQGFPDRLAWENLYGFAELRPFSRARLAVRQWPARKLALANEYTAALGARRKAQGKAMAGGAAVRARAILASGEKREAVLMSADFFAGQIEKAHGLGASVEVLESFNPLYPVGIIAPKIEPAAIAA